MAQALYRRGSLLFQRGAVADAKTLFVESLERSPQGRASADALRMLRAANRRLGIANLDHGRPPAPGQDSVLDPYGESGAAQPGEAPLDPYGAAGPAGPRDQTASEPTAAGSGSALGRTAVMAWSAAVGLLAGMAIAGPEDDSGEFGGGAAIAGAVGAAGGLGLSYWATRRTPLSAGQAMAVTSAATWGAVVVGLIGDAATGTDSEPNDVWKYVAAGGLVGLGGGVLYARAAEPTVDDIALIDSLSLAGAAIGIGIAAGIDPPESEAFSLNAVFGATAGVAAGALLGPRIQLSRRRLLFIDLGGLAGAAAAWGLLYPLIADDSSPHDEQITGWISTLTLTGGAALAWYFTAGMDVPDGAQGARRDRLAPAPPALAQRQADGQWTVGIPFVRPLGIRAPTGRGVGVDVISGRF